MITGAVKNRVDDIWQRMWEGGITNPIEVIMRLTYLMFMKSLDDKEHNIEQMEALGITTGKHVFPKTDEGQAIRWSHFKDLPAEQMFEVVSQKAFPFRQCLCGEHGGCFFRIHQTQNFGEGRLRH